jgi:hypothetical protein
MRPRRWPRRERIVRAALAAESIRSAPAEMLVLRQVWPRGGSLVVERAPVDAKATIDLGAVSPDALEIMRRLKSEFDRGVPIPVDSWGL